jgi:cytochrome c-type biogenesis protein CcmH/NrfG
MRLVFAACMLLLSVPAQAQEWWEAETDHFIVKSRDSEAETRAFAEELERYDGALRSLQNIASKELTDANKVTIFRFGDQGDIAHIAGASGSGIAGFYIPRAGASVAYVPAREDRRSSSIVRENEATKLDGMSVLKHEYAHHFMMQYFPGAYPRWYVEGYAETVATIRFLDDGSFHIGDPPQYRSFQVMRMPAFRLREMLDAKHELSGLDYMQHYGTGWLLSHYLNFDEEGRTKLTAFLSALAKGEDSLTAAERILGDLGELDRKLSSYRKGKFPGFNVKPANYVPPKVTMRRIPADEIAFMEQKMLLSRGIEKDDAPGIRNRVASTLANHPDSLEGYLLLAEANYDAEDYAAADAAALKATELDPQSLRAWLYRGMIATKQAADNPELAATARTYFTRASKLDGTDPRPLIGYYETYRELGQEPSEQAIIALEDAYDYAGSAPEYRFLLARQLLTEKRFADARTVVMPVAFDGHATGEADADEDEPTAGKLFKAIEDQDSDAAVALIEKILKPEDEDEKDGDDGKGG